MEIREEEFTLEGAQECAEIFEAHLREVQVVNVEPEVDWIRYVRASNRGDLVSIVARDNGKIVGYLGFWILPDINHDMVVAQQAGLYLKEEYRKGYNATKMIRFAEERLRERGVDAIVLISTAKKDLSSLFTHLNYKEAETSFLKEI